MKKLVSSAPKSELPSYCGEFMWRKGLRKDAKVHDEVFSLISKYYNGRPRGIEEERKIQANMHQAVFENGEQLSTDGRRVRCRI